MRRRILIPVLFLFVNLTYSQTTKYSNEFLSIGVGARSLSMSNAMVANTDDATSGYWNPAGLTSMQSDFDASLMHAEYFAGIGAPGKALKRVNLSMQLWRMLQT